MQAEKIIPYFEQLLSKFRIAELHAILKVFKVAVGHGSTRYVTLTDSSSFWPPEASNGVPQSTRFRTPGYPKVRDFVLWGTPKYEVTEFRFYEVQPYFSPTSVKGAPTSALLQ